MSLYGKIINKYENTKELKGEKTMDKDIVNFEDYDIQVDLKEIEKMDKKELEKCKKKIEEIKEMLNKK